MYRKDGKLGNCNCQMVTSANIDPDKISHLEGFDIHIVRGDYLPIKAPIYVNGLPYVFKEGEKLHSQCRMCGDYEYIVWDKQLDVTDPILEIFPTDTETLDPGYDYEWDMQIESADGTLVYTVIPTPSNVFLISDVTHRDSSTGSTSESDQTGQDGA